MRIILFFIILLGYSRLAAAGELEPCRILNKKNDMRKAYIKLDFDIKKEDIEKLTFNLHRNHIIIDDISNYYPVYKDDKTIEWYAVKNDSTGNYDIILSILIGRLGGDRWNIDNKYNISVKDDYGNVKIKCILN